MKFVSIFPRNKTGSDDVARAFVQSDPMINFAVVRLKFARKLGLYSTIRADRKIYPSILRAIGDQTTLGVADLTNARNLLGGLKDPYRTVLVPETTR